MSEHFEKVPHRVHLFKDQRSGLEGWKEHYFSTIRRHLRGKDSHVYNVTVPSLQTVLGREVLCKSTLTLKIAATNKSAHACLVIYGLTDAEAPLPLNNLVTTITATMNNNTVSENMTDAFQCYFGW